MTICEKCRYCVLEKEEIMAPPTLPKPKTFLGIPVQIYDPMAVMIYSQGAQLLNLEINFFVTPGRKK